MRRSARLIPSIENEAEWELKAKRNKLNDLITTIARMDNGTMVEAFKYLNYCQLAKNSLVSKRFLDVIKTHRYSLARLRIRIDMLSMPIAPSVVEIFEKELSSETYNEWAIWNNYSKQVPLENQVARKHNTQNFPDSYQLYAHYKDPNHREWNDTTSVFDACVELNHENWPVFQHFVCLIRDPFIYIDRMQLIYQNNFLNLLAEAINSDHDRLHCKELSFILTSNSQKFINWAKNHVLCDQFCVNGEYVDSNQNEALLDLSLTGANCTQSIRVINYDLLKAVVVLVQKFLDLENWNGYRGVQSIESDQMLMNEEIKLLKNYYAKFVVKEERDDDVDSTTYVFELINAAIGKKLQLTAIIFDTFDDYWYSGFPELSIEIKNM